MKNYILCVIATNDPRRMKDISQFIPWGEEIFSAYLSENQPKIHLVTLNILNDHIKWTRRKKSESIHHFLPKNMRVPELGGYFMNLMSILLEYKQNSFFPTTYLFNFF